MTPRLSLEHFSEFFTEVYGQESYPWQRELVARVLEEGRWPDVIDVPTGLGKTALIDIAVFVAAARPDVGRRRVFFVVDRRLVVDEAYEHACNLRDALQSGGGTCAEVARLLRQDGDDPTAVIDVTRMRGGTTWSWRWLERPDRHAIVTGTIDQVGSRLLFRGYGVGEFMRPIDAALTGTDSLIIIDEAHMAEPFTRTVQDAVSAEPDGARQLPVLITMSATTTPRTGETAHAITGADEDDPRAARVLNAARTLRPVLADKTKGAVERALADWAQRLAGESASGNVVAVVCNTVSRARTVFSLLRSADHADTVLLTGRIREIDRTYLARRGWYERSRIGRSRGPGRPLFLVATQTIEVGVNIDADALVTESAPLASLVQRLGRLNRSGALSSASAIVIHDDAARPEDPVYGHARIATWNWVSSLVPKVEGRKKIGPSMPLPPGLNVSPLALCRLTGGLQPDEAAAMRAPCPYIPVLATDLLDAWTRTSPVPHPDTPVAPFLHGIGAGDPDVSIVWRAARDFDPEAWKDMAVAVPPSAEEAIQVPLQAARNWLLGENATVVSDLDGAKLGQKTNGNRTHDSPEAHRLLIRYQDPEHIEFIQPRQIKPGDTLIVPAENGGCDEYGWNPASTSPVTDVADLAFRRHRPIMRLGPTLDTAASTYHPELAGPLADLIKQAADDIAEDGPNAHAYRQAIDGILEEVPPPAEHQEDSPLLRNLRILACSGKAFLYQVGKGSEVLLAARGGWLESDHGPLGSSALGAGDPAPLASHQEAVAQRAKQFAVNLRLDEQMVTSVVLAARLHDEGKRDPRFQAMLRGRKLATRSLNLEPLAKSGIDPADRAAFIRAWRASGYPAGMRHEALSARIGLLEARASGLDIDLDLVVHLIAAHHGRSRPLLPPIPDSQPLQVTVDLADGTHELSTAATVDWSAPRRFAQLNNRYGRWGLALLEAVVRLADIWCSERDERLTGESYDH